MVFEPVCYFAIMTSSNGNIFRVTVPLLRGIHRSPVNSPHKGQWRGALMFSMICSWTIDRINTRDAGDLRRHRTHYDVILMNFIRTYTWCISTLWLDFPCTDTCSSCPCSRSRGTFCSHICLKSKQDLFDRDRKYWIETHTKIARHRINNPTKNIF